jgi:drug/metabolite transporter (DMT)-like permease
MLFLALKVKKNLKAHIALLAVNVFYGANYSIAKISLPEYIQPAGYILLRTGASLLLYVAFLLVIMRGQSLKIDKGDILRFILCGITGVAINQVLFFEGLALTSPVHAALILTSNPLLVLVAAAFLIKEKITWRKFSGIFLGITGAVLLIIYGSEFMIGSGTMKGDLFILFNSMSYAVYLVLVKSLMKKYNPVLVVTWVFLFGLIFTIPFGYREFSQVQWSVMPFNVVLSVIYVIIFATFFAYLFNTYALKTVSAAVASYYIYIQPIIAAFIAYFLEEEKLTMLHLISCLMIFSGVFLVSKIEKAKLQN